MIYHTKLDFDYDLFFSEYKRLKSYERQHLSGSTASNVGANSCREGKYMIRWKDAMTSTVVSEYCNEIKRMFMLPGRVDGRFYTSKPFVIAHAHVDGKQGSERTQCSLNFILNDNTAGITFHDKGKETLYTYRQALLDVSQVHSVKNNDTDRILFKISIFHVCFDEVKEIMDHHGFLEK